MTVWNEGQKKALEEIKAWVHAKDAGMLSLSGYAGTGKSFLLNEIKKLLPGGSVAYSALTGKAALRMKELANVNATTLHSILYGRGTKYKRFLYFNKVAEPKTRFVVVDESSMISPKIYNDLKTWEAKNTKILIIGDPFQLPPVLTPAEIKEYGDDFSVFQHVRGPVLTQVMRSDDEIVKVLTEIRSEGKLPRKSVGEFKFVRTTNSELHAINEYMTDRDKNMLITWTNKSRMSANQQIRGRLGYTSVLPELGELVLLCQNGQDRLNGEIYVCEGFKVGPKIGPEVQTHRLMIEGEYILVSTIGKTCAMDGFMQNIVEWKQYTSARYKLKLEEPLPVTYGYCLTCHKAQGNQQVGVQIFMSEQDLHNPHFKAETTLPSNIKVPFSIRWIYTAASRSQKRLSIYLG